MKPKILFIGLSFFICFFVVSDAFAKRAYLEPVLPIETNSIRYVVPNDNGFRGYVQARDAKTEMILWEKTIYRVWRFRPFGEPDISYVHITKMKLENDSLLLSNERGQWYSLSLKTKRVKRISQKE
jgi:hypothetical protein